MQFVILKNKSELIHRLPNPSIKTILTLIVSFTLFEEKILLKM